LAQNTLTSFQELLVAKVQPQMVLAHS
jgi:hypothetical protein